MGQDIDYAAILADARAKRAALDNLIASLENAQALGALGQPIEGVTATGTGVTMTELPIGAFIGKSISAAIKLYLSVCRKRPALREIADALKEGGIVSTSDKFERIVLNKLKGLQAAGEVLRFKDGWGLAAQYPEQIRTRLMKEQSAPTKKPSKKQAKRSAKAQRKAAKPEAAVEQQATDQGESQRNAA